MEVAKMTSSELIEYITHDGKVPLDIDRLAEAIHKGKIKKVVLPDGEEVDVGSISEVRRAR